MAKTMQAWYESLPSKKQKEARDYFLAFMGRSTMYKVLAGEFSPSPDRCQKIADFAAKPIKFKEIVYTPQT